MIARWSKLHLSLGSEGHGNGASFAPAPPSMASRQTVPREQNLTLCGSCGDRGGPGSFPFPELKATFVGNLIGALINATEILDEYGGYPGESETDDQFLGFQASAQNHGLVLSNESLLRGDTLELLLHERSSFGSSEETSVSPLFDTFVTVPHWSRQHASMDNTARSSAAFRVGGFSQGQRKSPVSITQHPAEEGHENLHASTSEEDLLLQQARSKAYKGKPEQGATWRTPPSEASGDRPVDASFRGYKQARNIGLGMAGTTGGCAEAAEAWVFREAVQPCQQVTLFWGSIALVTLLTGVLLVPCRSMVFSGRHNQGPSVKRRILKSQWYGNRGAPPFLEHKTFQVKISEVPKYHALEVDGNRKLFQSPAEIGVSASFARKESQHLPKAQTLEFNSVRETGKAHVPVINKAQGQPIRQAVQSTEMLYRKQDLSRKVQPEKTLTEVSAEPSPKSIRYHHELLDRQKATVVSRPGVSGVHRKQVSNTVCSDTPYTRLSRMNISKAGTDRREWGQEDELDLDHRIQKLYQTIQAVEQHRRTALLAFEEEKQRSLALEQEMSKQREAAAVLEEEVRLLKKSHNALLLSLQKKYSTPAAARTAADLVYQDWERHVAAE